MIRSETQNTCVHPLPLTATGNGTKFASTKRREQYPTPPRDRINTPSGPISNFKGSTCAGRIPPDKRGGLNGSVQHLLAVYLPEFEIPKFFLDADLSAVRLCRALLENTLTSLFF
jgi:hypothetical protein